MLFKKNFDCLFTNLFVNLISNLAKMKKIITLLFLPASIAVYAQPKTLNQAIITTKTTIVASETDDAAIPAAATSMTNADGGEVRIMRFGGEGETKTTTWVKNDLVKTFSESEIGRTTLIRDNAKKVTTTIMEMMGRKTGVFATDDEQLAMSKRMDSMMRSKDENASFTAPATPSVYSIIYVDENKKISGYACKKALIIAVRKDRSDTTTAWYYPDFKIQNLTSTGGIATGFGGFNMSTATTGMELLNGFPMQYERNMRNGRKMTVEVTKIIIDKDITDKEFEVPKDIEMKPMKDMQNGSGPGLQMRIIGQ